jgi:NADH:ubiquinone oxidoreductase subunit 6 (subunit J)
MSVMASHTPFVIRDWCCALLVLCCLTIVTINTVHAVLLFISTLVVTAAMLYTIKLEFLALVYVILYIGAVVVITSCIALTISLDVEAPSASAATVSRIHRLQHELLDPVVLLVLYTLSCGYNYFTPGNLETRSRLFCYWGRLPHD